MRFGIALLVLLTACAAEKGGEPNAAVSAPGSSAAQPQPMTTPVEAPRNAPPPPPIVATGGPGNPGDEDPCAGGKIVTSNGSIGGTSTGGDANGGLDAEAIDRVVKTKAARLRACYQQSLARNADRRPSKLTIQFTIATTGDVSDAKVTGDSDPQVPDCITAVIKTLKFPAPSSPVTVKYPFVFQPS